MKLKEILTEITIKKLSKNINVKVDIDKTNHASERQNRHEKEISDNEIINTANKSLEKIARGLIFNKIDIGDYILIKDIKTNLNLISAIENNSGKLDLIIVTIMKKKDFKPKSGTKIVKV
jgi:hypothetical protein